MKMIIGSLLKNTHRHGLHVKCNTMRFASELRRFLETCTLSYNPNFIAGPLVFAQTLTDTSPAQTSMSIPPADIVVLLQVKQREGIQRWQRGLTAFTASERAKGP